MKKIIIFLLAIVSIFSCASCTGFSSDYNITESFNSNQVSYYSYSSDFTFEAPSSYSSSSRYNYSSNNFSNAQSSNDTVPTFYSLDSLRDYLNQQKNKNVFEIPFKFKGSDEITPRMLAQMTSALFVNHNLSGDTHTLTVSEYPGDHIVDAYFNSDKSGLTADEKKAMEKAIQMVNTAKSKAKNNWELELQIHDMLADHITYYDDVRDFDRPEDAPRYLTIIGALLDGKANCQGYSDAFYTLASIAGFTVSRMNTETTDDLHVVNTILLNGSWYVVDVTFDDQGSEAPTNYRLFNAGLDRIEEFFWKPWKEINKISATSPKEYYYNYKGTLFSNAQSLAQYVVNCWQGGEKTIRGAVTNLSDYKSIETPLSDLLEKTGKAYNYKYWCSNSGKDIYYTFVFN